MEFESLPLRRKASIEPQVSQNSAIHIYSKVVLFFAVGVIFVYVSKISTSISRRTPQENLLLNLAKKSNSAASAVASFTPEQLKVLAETAPEIVHQALIEKVKALPQSYIPTVDYADPCDALRVECCSDPAFPILGGMDVVHYRLTGEIVFGNRMNVATMIGVSKTFKLWFSQPSYVTLFEESPQMYLPHFGGFNAGEFCEHGGGLETLVKTTVDVSTAKDIGRHLAFGDSPDSPSTISACDIDFESFYGKPTNGPYNTRCVSMANLTVTVGLDPVSTVIPIRMSELYGISPGPALGSQSADQFQ